MRQWKEGRGRESSSRYPTGVEPTWGSLDLMTLRSWPEPKSRVGCLNNWATQVPQKWFFLCVLAFILFNFLSLFFFRNLLTQCGAQTHNSKIKSYIYTLSVEPVKSPRNDFLHMHLMYASKDDSVKCVLRYTFKQPKSSLFSKIGVT